MPDGAIPVKVSLKDKAGKEVAQATINVTKTTPGTHTFDGLLAGDYSLHYSPPDNYKINQAVDTVTLISAGSVEVKILPERLTAPPKEDKNPPKPAKQASLNPITLIPAVLIGLPLIFNGAFSKTPTSPNLEVPPKPSPSATMSPNRESENVSRENPILNDAVLVRNSTKRLNNQHRRRKLSPEEERFLKQCLDSNLKSLAGIPSLSSLLALLTNEEADSGEEFETQLIFLYSRVEELYAAIKECEATNLIENLIATETSKSSSTPFTATIVADTVNVRASPSLDSTVIERLTYNTIVQINTEDFANLAEQQKLKIQTGEGWLPIILADGRKGYVYSRYVQSSLLQSSLLQSPLQHSGR